MKPECIHCGREVEANTGYRRVTGWERIQRGPSGSKGFVIAEHHEECICRECAERIKHGVAPAQEALI